MGRSARVQAGRRAGRHRTRVLILLVALFFPATAGAGTFTVTTTEDRDDGPCTADVVEDCSLREAIQGSNLLVDEENTIVFVATLRGQTIALDSSLPVIVAEPPEGSDVGLTIRGPGEDGNRITVDGQADARVFFVERGVVNFDDLVVANGAGQGGDGGTRAGGGLGAGGGLFVNDGATVELRDVTFQGNSATGGEGGANVANRTGGGGGGLGGDGGAGEVSSNSGTGGGGGGLSLDGQDASDGGIGGGPGGDGGNTDGADGMDGGPFGGGGGGGRNNADLGEGGDGGYGGGGGGGQGLLAGGEGGLGGGDGANAPGGGSDADGGSAFGGAIFVREGGSLTIFDPDVSMSGVTAGLAGGSGGDDGSAEGADLYVDQDVEVELDVDATASLQDIGGAGGIRKSGDGMLSLLGEITYTGPTTVEQGTLELIDSFASETVTVQDGGVLSITPTVDDPTTLDAAITIQSGGVLRKSGVRKLILTGTMSSNGLVDVVIGQLEGDADSLDGDIELDSDGSGGVLLPESRLVFQQADDGTFTGNISGLGGVTKEGAGTLVLQGSNSYGGDTRVAAGTLQGDGDSLQGSIFVDTGATLVFDIDSGSDTFGDVALPAAGRVRSNGMGMDGTVVKRGAGELVLEGPFRQDSETLVQRGRLTLVQRTAGAAENIANDARVFSGATLGGDGSVGGTVTVESGGSVAPGPQGDGTPTATLDVGSVDFLAGSAFTVEVDPEGGINPADGSGVDDDTVRDQLAVAATADFDAAARVEVEVLAGSLGRNQSRVYRILTSADLDGLFPRAASEDLAFFDATVDRDPGNVDDLLLTLTRNDQGFADVAATANQEAVGEVLDAEDAAGASDDLQEVLDEFSRLSEAETQAALDEIGGEALSAFTTARIQNADKSARTTMARLGIVGGRSIGSPGTIELGGGLLSPGLLGGLGRMLADNTDAGVIQVLPSGSAPDVGMPPDEQRRVGLWLDGYGLFGDVDGNRNRADTDWRLGGVLGGVDLRLGGRGLLGLAGGYGRLDVGVDRRSLDGDANIFQALLYGGFVSERFYVGGTGRYAYSDFDTRRRLAFGDLDRRSKGDFDGHDAGVYVESGYVVYAPAEVQLEPMVSFHYTWLKRESFRESGAGSISLDVDGETWNSLIGTAGVRVHRKFRLGAESDFVFVPEIWARYAHQFGDRDRDLDASLRGGSTGLGWRVKGAEIGRPGGIFGVGWSVRRGKLLSALIYYDLNWNPDFLAHGIAGGLLVRF